MSKWLDLSHSYVALRPVISDSAVLDAQVVSVVSQLSNKTSVHS